MEWKPVRRRGRQAGDFRPLETFLVEWKPLRQKFRISAISSLETFLVEWKLDHRNGLIRVD